MTDISTETAAILTDTRGEGVRDAIVAACSKVADVKTLCEGSEGEVMTVNSDGEWEASEWT